MFLLILEREEEKEKEKKRERGRDICASRIRPNWGLNS